MFIKRNSRGNESAGITRRLAITGMAAGLAGAMLESPLRGQKPAANGQKSAVVQHKVVTATPSTQLWMAADMYGNKSGASLGTVIACPQSCAAARPGYIEVRASQSLSGVYLNTSEWMREIIYTNDPVFRPTTDQKTLDQAWRHYRRLLGFYRVSNDASTTGCGHISRNVVVTQMTLQSGSPTETPLGVGYSSLVFGGVQDTTSPLFQASNIYIFKGDWATDSANAPIIFGVVNAIGTDDRPIDVSACPA